MKLDKSVQDSAEAKASPVAASVPPTLPESEAIVAEIRKRRDSLAAAIDRGKGTWPEDGYVRDDTWAGWQARLGELDGLLCFCGIDPYAEVER